MSSFEGLNLTNIPPEGLNAIRKARGLDITRAINEINLINVELNRRLGTVALPEFGNPMTSLEPDKPPDLLA